MLRTLPVAAEMLGLVSAGQPEPAMVWEDVNGRRTQTDRQETDPDTGELIWTVYGMPTLAERPEVLAIRTRARQQPVLTQFGPITVDSLEVNVRIDKAGKLVQYWSAAGVRDASGKQQHRPEHKPQDGQAA